MKTLAAFLSIYVSRDGEERLSQYHYTGKDNSFLQRYLYIPIADFLLDHVIPSWLKTDYLYIISFIFVLYPHIVIAAIFSRDLNGHVHRWLSFITAFSLFLYLVLKSTGKRKAERRGYITPLNAFLDHQTNTVNIFLTGLSFFTIIQLGNTDYSVVAFIVAFVPFYTATWERYYTGEYNRSLINGQTEGLTVIVLIEVITGAGGYGIWPQPSESGLRSNEILVLITAAWAILAVFFKKVWIKSRARFGRALFDLLWIGYTVAMLFVLSYMSVTNTVSRRARDLITYVGLFLGKYCLFFFDGMQGLLQVAHMSGDKFKSFWYSKYIANSFLIADCVQGYYTATNIIDEDFSIQTLMIYQFVRYITFLVSILFQLNEIQKHYPSHLPLQEKLKLDLKSMTQYGFTERPDSHAHADHAKTPTSQASTDTPIKVSMISLQKKMISLPLVLPEKPPLAVADCHTP